MSLTLKCEEMAILMGVPRGRGKNTQCHFTYVKNRDKILKWQPWKLIASQLGFSRHLHTNIKWLFVARAHASNRTTVFSFFIDFNPIKNEAQVYWRPNVISCIFPSFSLDVHVQKWFSKLCSSDFVWKNLCSLVLTIFLTRPHLHKTGVV